MSIVSKEREVQAKKDLQSWTKSLAQILSSKTAQDFSNFACFLTPIVKA